MNSIRKKLAALSPRAKHHCIITLVVGTATLAHYIFALFAPDFIDLSPLAGFLASLVWIWLDAV